MRHKWTWEEIALLIDLYDIMSMPELAVRFGVTQEAIKSQIGNLELKRHCTGIDYVRFPGSAKPCEVLLIAALYPVMPAYKLVKYLPGRDVRFVTRTVFKNQVQRDETQTAKVNKKNRGRFKKGQRSWNEGTHYTAGGRSAETRFSPGQTPANALPAFTTVQRADKKGKPFMMIKVPGQGMKFLNRWTWEQAKGPIPQGMMVCHIDGNPLNCDISNLALRTRAENAKLTGTNNRNNDYRSAKLRLIAVEKRIANAKPLIGDFELQTALKAWIEEHEAQIEQDIQRKKAAVKAARKSKIKRVKAAPDKVKPPKVVDKIAKEEAKAKQDAAKALRLAEREAALAKRDAEKQAAKAAREAERQKRIAAEAQEKLERDKENKVRKEIRRNQERQKAQRLIQDGQRKVDTTTGKQAAETWLRFEIDRKTIKFVKPSNKEAFMAKHPTARQLFN